MSDASDIAAVGHAKRLGCELHYREHPNLPTRYYWSYGRRGSADHCVDFDSLGDAARHFLNSREGIMAASRAIRNGTSEEAFIDLPPGHPLKPFYDAIKDEA
jgi:hypothetical protein